MPPVALKFLPSGVAADDIRLAQFHNELRIARQVSHKNVCRLYDLGDALTAAVSWLNHRPYAISH